MTLPIANGKDTLLSQNNGVLPNMRDALLGWFRQLNFVCITKSIVAYDLVEVKETITAQGVLMPAGQFLDIRATGQRKWTKYVFYCFPDLILSPDDIIVFTDVVAGDTNYRIMAKNDFKEYGYVSYDCTQDWKPMT